MKNISDGDSYALLKPIKRIINIMKLTFLALFLCVTGLFATGASSQVAKVTITAQSTPFGEILSNIEKQTDYYFVYDKRDIDLNRKVSIDAREKTVEEVLSTIFRNTDIVYAMKSNNIILMKNNDRMLAIMQQANRKTITGVVLDPQGESIIGANVMEKGTSNGTITDIDGSFTLDVASNATLQVTYIGYMAQEVPVKNQSSVRILMKEDTQNLEEVVVVGYGVQKKANLTGAVSVVSSKDLKDVSSSSVSQALQGKLSGVVITKSNGQPGASSDIRIRGMGTFGDNAPLVVIDGIPADGGLESISSSDIESVNVLKDAASAAIYGSRAANGVILVTTKRGVSEKSSISVDGYFGLQRITRYLDMCNAAEFVELQNEAIANANRWIGGSNITPYFTNDPASYGKGTDWGKELFSVAPTYNVNVSAQGGSQNSSYYMSGGYVDQEGILENTSYNKANFRINNDNKYGERLSFGTSINLSTSLQHGTSNAAGDAYNVSPTIPLYEADGITPGYDKHPGETGINPVYMANLSNPDHRTYKVLGNIYVEYKIFDFLRFRINAGLDFNYYEKKSFTPTYNIADKYGNTRSSYEETRGKNVTWLTDYLLYFDHTFSSKHSIDGMAGFSQQLTTDDDIYGKAYDYVSESKNMQILNGGTNPTDSRNSGAKSQLAMMSWFGRINYNFADRYLLSFNLRADGSSRFASGNRWGFFPSFSGAWRISQEEFFNVPAISNLKLRLNWGQLGNQSVSGRYPTIATLSNMSVLMGQGGYNHSIVPGYYVANLVNKDLKWETTTITNAGVDVGLLDNRLTASAEYYDKRTSGILRQQVIPGTVGLGAPNVNFAKVANRGVELEINWQDKINKDFTYYVGANISTVRNKILQLSDGKDEELRDGGHRDTYINKVGYAIDSFYGWEMEGVYASQEDIDNSPAYGSAIVGSIKFKDQNGDNKIDADDRVILGNSIPKMTFGFKLGAQYKNFDFSMFWQGDLGKKQFMPYEKWVNDGSINYGRWWYENRWNGEGTPGKWPAVIWGGAYSMYQMNDFLLTNSSYARLKNLSVGYSFDVVSKYKFRVYVSGENLVTITSKGFYGYDPERSGTAQYNNWAYSYPAAMTFMIGANIKF